MPVKTITRGSGGPASSPAAAGELSRGAPAFESVGDGCCIDVAATAYSELPESPRNTCYLAALLPLVRMITEDPNQCGPSAGQAAPTGPQALISCLLKEWSQVASGPEEHKSVLGRLALALMGHAEQDDPMTALARILATVPCEVPWGHYEMERQMCGQCGEVRDQANKANRLSVLPLRLTVPANKRPREGASSVSLECLVKTAFEVERESLMACCSGDLVSFFFSPPRLWQSI